MRENILEQLQAQFHCLDFNKINFILSVLIFRFFPESKLILSWLLNNSQF
ncbi:hypothetical protein CSC03_1154 [Enterobacter hormaechei]|nr:hypothetical protein CSC19_0292 [Enterobacter hormaechei]AWZ96792.1 hypothetical protein CSB67_3299 [Enterobacter hormaechei]KAF0679816.1 hypothetical protein Y59_19450 [Enterobacter hormaechei]PRW24580.1 hypothetical protein CSC03_1154 [Enterobacter hormaechei]